MASDVLVAAVPASLIITVLVQIAKRLGMRTALSPVLAIGLGVLYTVVAYVVRLYPGLRGVYEAIGTGITLGLTACGLYSGSKAMIGRSPLGAVRARVRERGAIVEGSARPVGKVGDGGQ